MDEPCYFIIKSINLFMAIHHKIILIFLMLGCITASASPLNVLVLQLYVSLEDYSDFHHLENKIINSIEKYQENQKIDLIILPEYTFVFLALTPDYQIIKDQKDFIAAFGKIHSAHKEFSSIKQFFLQRAPEVKTQIFSMARRVCTKYNTSLLAGSFFDQAHEFWLPQILVNRSYEPALI